MHKKSILYVGLFVDKNDPKKNIRTSADRIAELFLKNNIDTITTSQKRGRAARLIENISVTVSSKNQFNIAIVPLFGTWPSFIWQEIITRLLKILNKKVIITVNGGSIPQRMDANPARFLKALKRADAIISPSGFMFHYLKKHNIQTHLIENPINVSEYTFYLKANARPKLIWMRSFEDVYNPEMAIRVAVLLAKKYPDFTMVMAGRDHGMQNQIIAMANASGLQNKVVFPGYISMQQKLQYAQTHDIYICTNRIDNAPVSLIEFMALGLPVVAVNTGGIPYMIEDGFNGLLVNLDDDAAMVHKIELLINDPDLCRTISNNAYNYSRHYGEAAVLNKWQHLFEKLNTV